MQTGVYCAPVLSVFVGRPAAFAASDRRLRAPTRSLSAGGFPKLDVFWYITELVYYNFKTLLKEIYVKR